MGYIYKITNTVNGKSYIGKTIHDPEKGRIRQHLNEKAPECRALHNAIKKYGREAFAYKILHKDIIPEMLDIFEVIAIKSHDTFAPNGYNLTIGGEGGSPSEETREKLRLANLGKTLTPEHRQKIADANRGKKASEEARRKMSESHIGKPAPNKGKKLKLTLEQRKILSQRRKGSTHPPETKAKISESLKKTFRKKGGHSPEAKAKISAANKGRPSPLKGVPRSPETKAKVSAAHKGKKRKPHSAETRAKMSNTHKRRPPRSEEHNRKLSESLRKSPRAIEQRQKLAKKLTSPERIPARAFFFSLPPDMDLKEKRHLLQKKINGVTKDTLNRWTREWHSELE